MNQLIDVVDSDPQQLVNLRCFHQDGIFRKGTIINFIVLFF